MSSRTGAPLAVDGLQVFKVLAESVGQPGKPAHAHSHRQILPFKISESDCLGARKDRS
jgi:hypothetical protein